jgi:hypothetical protein
MDENECYIEPVVSGRRTSRAARIDESDSEPPRPSKRKGAPNYGKPNNQGSIHPANKSFMDTIKEYKVIIIIFAIASIILLFLIIWMFSKNEKGVIGKANAKGPPVGPPGAPAQPPNTPAHPPAQPPNTPAQPPNTPAQPPAQPPAHPPAQPPAHPPNTPAQPEEDDSLHEQVMRTVDDEELNMYMNVRDEKDGE